MMNLQGQSQRYPCFGGSDGDQQSSPARESKAQRVWCSGSFDLLHCGHADLLRRVKSSEKSIHVVVGLHSDKEMIQRKQVPVFTEEERYDMLAANKWVDEIVKDAPYDLTNDSLTQFCCDFSVRGTCAHRERANIKELKRNGIFKEFKKYPGISTEDIIHRILGIEDRNIDNSNKCEATWNPANQPVCGVSCSQILKFATGDKPSLGDRVVYVAGAYDLLHPGHVKFLEKARQLGDFLIVGVHGDETVKMYNGDMYPIMRLEERVLGVLSCKHVSEVVIDAPFNITSKLLNDLRVRVVAHGKIPYQMQTSAVTEIDDDPFKESKSRDIFNS